MPKDSVRCFLCDKGFVWSLNADGQTNYPAEIFVCNNKYNKTVLILGEKEMDAISRKVVAQYVLFPSLSELSKHVVYGKKVRFDPV